MLASGKIVRANPRAGKKARREMTVPFFHITLFSLRCTKKALEGRSLGSKRRVIAGEVGTPYGPSSKGRSACLLERVRTEVRSETFEAKVLRTPYLFISGLGHCTLLTFYGMLSPEKKVISVIFSSFAPKPRTAHWYS